VYFLGAIPEGLQAQKEPDKRISGQNFGALAVIGGVQAVRAKDLHKNETTEKNGRKYLNTWEQQHIRLKIFIRWSEKGLQFNGSFPIILQLWKNPSSPRRKRARN
jgi:hypothetical protein